ncbi:hypothetical protein ABZ832_20545 [Streptantibioticus parmotrematis]|uniref:hypothetical protein n=1 Tax=Streptantibioticus parmotrematis TaxID=2873249 RepID=UPI003401BD2B
MGGILFDLTTAWLLMLMAKCGVNLVGSGTLTRRPVPWVAVGLAGVAVAGVGVQVCWAGAMAALDDDPRRRGWWRVLTSVFLQNGGVFGAVWNLVTLAVVAALAQWFWGAPLTLGLFAAGVLLPQHLDALLGLREHVTDPRDFAGSSGATYFLAATLAAGLLLRATTRTDRLLALAVPAAGLALWAIQGNEHGLVAVYGFLLGLAVLPLFGGGPALTPRAASARCPRP